MILNRELWDLGDPELDDKGQPDIHDIASKLGRITKTQIKPAGLETDTGKKLFGSLPSLPPITHAVRASSSESDSSANHNNEMLEQQQQQQWQLYEDNASDVSIISTRDANTSIPSPTYEDFQSESSLDELWLDLSPQANEADNTA